MNREPIFWTTTGVDYNKFDRERPSFADGEPRIERFPQTGHIGDYENKVVAQGQRFVWVCRGDGNVVALVMTNAAAHLDTNTAFATWQRRKCYALGWFAAAGCVAKLVQTGELGRKQLAAPLERDVVPCEGGHSLHEPCAHTAREIDARRARNKSHNDARMAKFKTEADALLEETRKTNAHLADANTQSAETNARMADALELLAQRLAPAPAPAAPAADPPKRRGDKGSAE